MGPIWFINLDINKLNKNVILYSSFDVLYLKELLNKLIKLNSEEEIDIISGMSSINFIYRLALPVHSNYIDKISEYNVHMLFDNNKVGVKFNDIFDLYYYWYNDDIKIYSKFTEINFFKRLIQSIVKIYLYSNFTNNTINSNYGIFTSSLKDDDKKYIKEIERKYNEFYNKLGKHKGYHKILKFIKNINLSINSDFIKKN